MQDRIQLPPQTKRRERVIMPKWEFQIYNPRIFGTFQGQVGTKPHINPYFDTQVGIVGIYRIARRDERMVLGRITF